MFTCKQHCLSSESRECGNHASVCVTASLGARPIIIKETDCHARTPTLSSDTQRLIPRFLFRPNSIGMPLLCYRAVFLGRGRFPPPPPSKNRPVRLCWRLTLQQLLWSSRQILTLQLLILRRGFPRMSSVFLPDPTFASPLGEDVPIPFTSSGQSTGWHCTIDFYMMKITHWHRIGA